MSTPFSHFFTKFNQISPLETNFTEVLESIALKPKTLYFYGKLPENILKNGKSERPKVVAVVGSRRNTTYGKEVAYKIAYALAKEGVIIVSGLAYGIDSVSHRACLDAGGKTVAILGTPIDQIYPRSHLSLAGEIIEKGGAIISEYAPSTAKNAPIAPGEAVFDGAIWHGYKDSCPKNILRRRIEMKASFLYRNRLISALSDAVVIVEAAERSGTLNTAAHALEQGKDVFAVPGNITSPYSVGCNRLIKQGAFPYTEPEDILRQLFPEDFAENSRSVKKDLAGDTPEETAILKVLLEGLRDGEHIMETLEMPAAIFNETITVLEIKGFVRSLGANNWGLVS